MFDMFFVLYAICGVGSLCLGALAATKCDLVLFMASNECFKLIITAFTGHFIWLDTPRPGTELSYVMAYIMICVTWSFRVHYGVHEMFNWRLS